MKILWEILSQEEVTKIILDILKKKFSLGKKVKIKFVKDRPGHDIRYAINSNKIKKQLKWKPRVKFKEGLNSKDSGMSFRISPFHKKLVFK